MYTSKSQSKSKAVCIGHQYKPRPCTSGTLVRLFDTQKYFFIGCERTY